MTTPAPDVVEIDGEEVDYTRSFLDDEERDRYRHMNSQYGLMIALGMRKMNVYQGTFHEGRYLKRRTRNRLAKKSRRINRIRRK